MIILSEIGSDDYPFPCFRCILWLGMIRCGVYIALVIYIHCCVSSHILPVDPSLAVEMGIYR